MTHWEAALLVGSVFSVAIALLEVAKVLRGMQKTLRELRDWRYSDRLDERHERNERAGSQP